MASHISVTAGVAPQGAQRPLEDVCATDRRRLEIISSVFNALRGNILCDFFFNYFFELFLEFSVNPSVQVVGLPPSPWERRILGAHVTRTMLLIFKDVHVVA